MSRKFQITENLSINQDEIGMTFSRASGPGGQNVNKVATRVTLRLNLSASASLTSAQKKRLMEKLRNSINARGELVLHEDRGRTQLANRRRALQKLRETLGDALKTKPHRIPVPISAGSVKKRLNDKRIKGIKKRERKKVDLSE